MCWMGIDEKFLHLTAKKRGNMEIQEIKIEQIKPYKNNAKKHSETQIANVAESIKQFGWAQPIVLDSNKEIIIGHCRYLAAQRLGMLEVPCLIVDLSAEKVKKLRNLDNKLNESEWDFDLLKDDILGLDFDGFDIDWGIEEGHITDIVEDDAPEVDEQNEPITQLGSDMADSVTGGGLHGKDLSKADVSVNIYAFLKAQETGRTVELCCAIGDGIIDGIPYSEIVEVARAYIKSVGGFEKFAEWGLF